MAEKFSGCIFYNVSTLNRKISKIAEEKFKEIDLVPTHAFLLVVVGNEKQTSPTYISKCLNLKPSTITRFLDKLTDDGLLIRKFSGKNTIISLSQKGIDIIPLIKKSWEELNYIYINILGETTCQLLEISNVAIQKFNEKK